MYWVKRYWQGEFVVCMCAFFGLGSKLALAQNGEWSQHNYFRVRVDNPDSGQPAERTDLNHQIRLGANGTVDIRGNGDPIRMGTTCGQVEAWRRGPSGGEGRKETWNFVNGTWTCQGCPKTKILVNALDPESFQEASGLSEMTQSELQNIAEMAGTGDEFKGIVIHLLADSEGGNGGGLVSSLAFVPTGAHRLADGGGSNGGIVSSLNYAPAYEGFDGYLILNNGRSIRLGTVPENGASLMRIEATVSFVPEEMPEAENVIIVFKNVAVAEYLDNEGDNETQTSTAADSTEYCINFGSKSDPVCGTGSDGRTVCAWVEVCLVVYDDGSIDLTWKGEWSVQ